MLCVASLRWDNVAYNELCGFYRGLLTAQSAGYFVISFQHALTGWTIENQGQFAADVRNRETVGHQLWDDLAVGNQVD